MLSNWIKVEDKLPEAEQEVIAWATTYDEILLAFYDPEEKMWSVSAQGTWEGTTIEVSHWMSLPHKPDGSEPPSF